MRVGDLAHGARDLAVVDGVLDPVGRAAVADVELDVEDEVLAVLTLVRVHAVPAEEAQIAELDRDHANAFATRSASTCGADVVHAQDRRAALVRRDRSCDARAHEVGGAEPLQRALAREADEHRPPEREQDVEPAHELEVVLDRLAEADAGVEADALLGDALRDRECEALLEERGDLGGDVVVVRFLLHRARRALHVHEAEVRVRVCDDARRAPGRRAAR